MPENKIGVAVIKDHASTLGSGPGVYRMININGEVLYVGKAKNLKKRVMSYTKLSRQSLRMRRMITSTWGMEFVTTHTEAEALLLESNLIKRFLPKYNILLRDDKSFPFILLTRDHVFPQVIKYRGAQTRKGKYFGPFASVWSVNEAISILQKAFLLRTCSDSVFKGRSRPCLLYQIKRCSAPCVGNISSLDYAKLVSEAREFLEAGSQKIQGRLAILMEEASSSQNYEIAAQYRDRIRALANVQARQDINISGVSEADVIATFSNDHLTCVQVFFFRGGSNYGNRAYFPSHARGVEISDIIEAFIGQFYSRIHPAKTIILNEKVPNKELLEKALSVRAKQKICIKIPQRGEKRKLVEYALINAREAHSRRMAETKSQKKLLKGLASVLNLDQLLKRIEVYDNSHISGTNAVGAMIVAGEEGFIKREYRKFTIKGVGNSVNPILNQSSLGDDYAMIREVLTRRFERAKKEEIDGGFVQLPDLIIVDGGKGQLNIAIEVLKEAKIKGIGIVSIAKSADRRAGKEHLYLPGNSSPILLEISDPVFSFVQRLRDEAHRFAIGVHRRKRSNNLTRSVLDEIPRVGPSRKRALLNHFGGPEAVAQAGVPDLELVEGISKDLAKKIYDWFQN